MDKGPTALIAEMGGRCARNIERTMQVHADDGLPIRRVQLVEYRIAQNASIVHNAVQATECVHRTGDNFLCSGIFCNRVCVRDGFPASLANFSHDVVRGGAILALTVAVCPNIIDDDFCAMLGGQHGNAASDSASCARNDDDLAF